MTSIDGHERQEQTNVGAQPDADGPGVERKERRMVEHARDSGGKMSLHVSQQHFWWSERRHGENAKWRG